MDIICDTNIWYNIGNGLITLDFLKPDDRLIASYINIDEFYKTSNIIDRPRETRKAIQAMFIHSSKHAIYYPPLVYIKRLDTNEFGYDIMANMSNILEFTQRIANGQQIKPEKHDDYRNFCLKRKENIIMPAQLLNDNAKKIRLNIKNKAKHRKEDSIELNRDLISFFVAAGTKSSGLSTEFDWNQIELFQNALKVFFNDLETGATIMKPNDWYDLFILVYVSPEQKYWTRETKWIDIIKRAGMEKYLIKD